MNLEYLRHGKALCGQVFRRFVETFNFHNDFIDNLKGDAELQVVGGRITLDRADERHPVIRCRACEGSSSPEAVHVPAPFDLVKDDNLSRLIVSSGRFYFNGYPKTVGELNLGSADYTGSVYLHGERREVGSTWSFALSQTAVTTGTNTICIILYDIEDGVVTMDYRTTFLALTATDVPDYIAGDNTNIIFTPVKEEGTGRQQYKVDVYYI